MYIFLKLKTQIIIWWKAVYLLMNRRLTEPIFRVSESYWNVKIYFLNTCGGGSLENRKLPFHCSSAFRIIRALNKPVYGLIRNDLMRRRKKKTIYFLWSYQKSKSICGHYLGKKREKKTQCSKRHRVYVNFLYLSKISREISEPLKNT